MKAKIVPSYLTVLATSVAAPTPGTPEHAHLKAVALMEAAGDKLSVDSAEIDRDARRIHVKLTRTAPSDRAQPEATPFPISIDLGRPEAGTYVVEIELRSGAKSAYELQQALVISITDVTHAALAASGDDAPMICMTPEQIDDERPPQKEED